jgi:hypothetical protein
MVVLPLLHLAVSKVPRTRKRVVHILLLYALVFGVGVIGLPLGFIPHVFRRSDGAIDRLADRESVPIRGGVT